MTVASFLHSNHIVHVERPHSKVAAIHIIYGGPSVIDSYKVPTFHIRYGEPSVIDIYKVPTFHIRYGGPYKSLTVTRFPYSISGMGRP